LSFILHQPGQQLTIQGLEAQRVQIEIYDRNGALVSKSNRMAGEYDGCSAPIAF
jgi:hypothetical protein